MREVSRLASCLFVHVGLESRVQGLGHLKAGRRQAMLACMRVEGETAQVERVRTSVQVRVWGRAHARECMP